MPLAPPPCTGPSRSVERCTASGAPRMPGSTARCAAPDGGQAHPEAPAPGQGGRPCATTYAYTHRTELRTDRRCPAHGTYAGKTQQQGTGAWGPAAGWRRSRMGTTPSPPSRCWGTPCTQSGPLACGRRGGTRSAHDTESTAPIRGCAVGGSTGVATGPPDRHRIGTVVGCSLLRRQQARVQAGGDATGPPLIPGEAMPPVPRRLHHRPPVDRGCRNRSHLVALYHTPGPSTRLPGYSPGAGVR